MWDQTAYTFMIRIKNSTTRYKDIEIRNNMTIHQKNINMDSMKYRIRFTAK